MTLPALGMFRHPDGKTHVVVAQGDQYRTLCTRATLKRGGLVDPDTATNCASCGHGGWGNRRFSSMYVSVATLHGGLE